MKQFIAYIIIAVCAVLGACKKTEYPKETRVDGNYFYSELNVDGSPLTLKAGQNGYYMYSSYSTSTVDSFSISKYTGEFRQADCETCNNSIKIQINDPALNGQNTGDVNQVIKPNTFSFFSGTNNLRYEVKFNGQYQGTASQVNWEFGDSESSTDLNPTHLYKAGVYKVRLRIKGTNSCESVIEHTLSVGPNTFNSIINNSVNMRKLSFTPVVYGGTAPYTYYWTFGDGTPEVVTTTLTTAHTYPFKGSYPVKLKVKDAQGFFCYSNLNAVTQDDSSACASNFSYPQPKEIMVSYGSPNVSIQFTDVNGIIYNTDSSSQPETSSFEILSVEEFQKNEKGEPVKRVKLKFNCVVYNGSKKINLIGKEVYIGLGYKN